MMMLVWFSRAIRLKRFIELKTNAIIRKNTRIPCCSRVFPYYRYMNSYKQRFSIVHMDPFRVFRFTIRGIYVSYVCIDDVIESYLISISRIWVRMIRLCDDSCYISVITRYMNTSDSLVLTIHQHTIRPTYLSTHDVF